MDISGKVVLVTGAGRGLGQRIAVALAAKGARLGLVARHEDQLAETVEACEAAGGHAHAYPGSVASEQDVERVFGQLVEDFGGLHGVVNNAGITRDGFLIKAKEGRVTGAMSLDDWQSVLDVNLTGVFLCGREAARRMIETGEGGVIVNMSSVNRAGNPGQGNYAASKAGVAALTVTWARELSRYGIRVAGLAPGYCDTDMVAQVSDEILQKIKDKIPLRRLGAPDEIAQSVVYVMENDYFAGRVLEVDGGLRV